MKIKTLFEKLFEDEEQAIFNRNIEEKTLESREIIDELRKGLEIISAENKELKGKNEQNDINCWEWLQKRYEMLASVPTMEDYEAHIKRIKKYEDSLKTINQRMNTLETVSKEAKTREEGIIAENKLLKVQVEKLQERIAVLGMWKNSTNGITMKQKR